MKTFKKYFAAAVLAASTLVLAPVAQANEGPALDRFPVEKMTDAAALQNGAKLFVNYCLNCHSAVSRMTSSRWAAC